MARRAARFCVRSRQQMSGLLSNQRPRLVQQSIGVRCTTLLLRAMFT